MSDARQLCWEDVTEGDAVPRITLVVDYRRVILNAAATWDFMPAHHDPVYARSMGRETIFLNTMFFEGFIERVGTQWAGPKSFVKRRKMQLKGALYPGQTAYGEGVVARKRGRERGGGLIDLLIDIGSEAGPCCTGELTLRLPVRAEIL